HGARAAKGRTVRGAAATLTTNRQTLQLGAGDLRIRGGVELSGGTDARGTTACRNRAAVAVRTAAAGGVVEPGGARRRMVRPERQAREDGTGPARGPTEVGTAGLSRCGPCHPCGRCSPRGSRRAGAAGLES